MGGPGDQAVKMTGVSGAKLSRRQRYPGYKDVQVTGVPGAELFRRPRYPGYKAAQVTGCLGDQDPCGGPSCQGDQVV
jgi:hypothetical protein